MKRTQRVHEKNSVICLVMFTPGVMAIKMTKMVNFLYFLLLREFIFGLSSFFDTSTLKRLLKSKAH